MTGPGLSAEPPLAFSAPFTVNDAVIVTRHHPCFSLRIRNEKEGEGVAPLANGSQAGTQPGTGIGASVTPLNNFLDTHPL